MPYFYHRYILFLLVFYLLNPVKAQFKVLDSGTGKDLHTLFFVDSKIGFAGGDEGALVKTDNAGKVWKALNPGIAETINGIHFIDADTGFIIGENNTFLTTHDGGDTWKEIALPVRADLTAITFINEKIGYVIGHGLDGGIFVSTDDGGENWVCRVINENCNKKGQSMGWNCDELYLTNLSFLNETEGLVGGFAYNYQDGKKPFIAKTTDGGQSFIDVSPQPETEHWNYGYEIVSLNYLTSHDATAIFNTGRGNSFLYLSDYRIRTFKQHNNELFHDYHELYFSSWFLDRYIGYFTCLVNGRSQILKTFDLGESFMYLNPPTNNTLYATFFTDSENGYFVGQNGTILHYFDDRNIIWNEQKISDNIYFEPPFTVAVPNNRNTKTDIYIYNLDVNDKSEIDLSLRDRYGEVVEIKRSRIRLFDNEIRLMIKTDELNSGTYFYTLKNEEQALINGKINVGSYAQVNY
jgi:photosystem II stability/assembly factor-like uncharacterized protein